MFPIITWKPSVYKYTCTHTYVYFEALIFQNSEDNKSVWILLSQQVRGACGSPFLTGKPEAQRRDFSDVTKESFLLKVLLIK